MVSFPTSSLFAIAIFALVRAEEDNVKRNKLFTASVYKEVVKTEGNKNVLVSPLSAEIIFALAQTGAKAATAEELQTALFLPPDQDKIKSVYQQLVPLLKGDSFVLEAANRVYLEEIYPVEEQFKLGATDIFQCSVETVDFTKSEESAAIINNWVKNQTENKIDNLVTPDQITHNTVVLLINALYFKAKWLEKFSIHHTKKRDFYKTGTEVIQVETMHNPFLHEPFNFYENAEMKAKFLEVPFEGTGGSMVFVLPEEKDGIGRLEARIEDVLEPQPYALEYLDVTLPKFRIEALIDFKEIFRKLGAKLAFTHKADFSGIGGDEGDIFISEALQKALVEVNEEGVEAAAVTTIKLMLLMAPMEPSKEFKADHPFIYYIKVNGLILFVGKVVEPQYRV